MPKRLMIFCNSVEFSVVSQFSSFRLFSHFLRFLWGPRGGFPGFFHFDSKGAKVCVESFGFHFFAAGELELQQKLRNT